jgi:hypothetical protein
VNTGADLPARPERRYSLSYAVPVVSSKSARLLWRQAAVVNVVREARAE